MPIFACNNYYMAFVGIEDKFGEGEVIVFPNLYEKVGAKLQQDAVIRVTGKNSARDRDGNLGGESKLIADDIIMITDDDVDNYESTGRKMDAPKISAAVKKERRADYKNQRRSSAGGSDGSKQASAAVQPATKQPAVSVAAAEMPAVKLFVPH